MSILGWVTSILPRYERARARQTLLDTLMSSAPTARG
jgi:hypothetical protein